MTLFRLKKVSMPLGEVSVSSAMAEDNTREKAPTTKKKQPPPIAAFLAMDLNKSPSKENKVLIFKIRCDHISELSSKEMFAQNLDSTFVLI